MPRLIAALMRHGDYEQPAEVPGALVPYPLSEKGQAQAREVAVDFFDQCAARGFQVHPTIDCSSTRRASQTAEIIAEAASARLGVRFEPREFEVLSERSVGAAANLTMDQIAEIIRRDPRYPELPPEWKKEGAFRLPFQGAESLIEAGRRVAGHLARTMAQIARRAERDTVKLFVGHGGAFRFAAVDLGLLDAERARDLSMYHCSAVWLEYGPAAGAWRHDSGEWKVRKRRAAVAHEGGKR